MKKYLFLLVAIIQFQVFAQQDNLSFFPDGEYDNSIPAPDSILGFTVGEKPARYNEVYNYFKFLAEKSAKVNFVESGETYENRKLFYIVISSEDNINNLDRIRENISDLSNPRKTNSSEAEKISEVTPAVAFMMYSIHGDELSGTDASIQIAYQLAAGTDTLTEKILNKLIVIIYPMENPDGRERYLSMMEQWKGTSSSHDIQSIQHQGLWPYGRTNHYLFDLNRDWFILAHPESRERVKAIVHWYPQLVVDAHEMGPLDTHLFNPPREPINPNLSKSIQEWWRIFASDQAKAFDNYGWSYYTREWLEEWYPGYGSSWPSYMGAVSILYEQASTDGSLIKRQDGTFLTFRDAVHRQFISSLANLTTTANNRKELLKNYYEGKADAVFSDKEVKTYLIDPSKNPSRTKKLIKKLLLQGIEIEVAENEFKLGNVKSFWDKKSADKNFPEGTYIIKTSQPLSPLINALMEFDPHTSTKFLNDERESLEKGEGTRLYEVSSWSLLIAYDVDAYVSNEIPEATLERVKEIPEMNGEVINPNPTYGFLINYNDDNSVKALIKFLEMGYKIRSGKEPFKIEGRKFSSGSLLLRVNENSSSLSEDVQKISEITGVDILGVSTALSEEGPDLGGNDFPLLAQPRIALLTGNNVSTGSFGSIWYLLDNELNLKFSILDAENVSGFDLRKYNVLIIPSSSAKKIFGKEDLKKLKDWVSDGGTLISIGESSVFLADTSSDFSKVKLKSQALKELSLYEYSYSSETSVGKYKVDSIAFWNDKIHPDTNLYKKIKEAELKELELKDEKHKLFSPRGAILQVDVDTNHWIGFGMERKVPAIVYTSEAFLSRNPVQTPARFTASDSLRLSGILWPEARERWEKTSYITREPIGKGQLILFAGEPTFRSYFYGTAKLFLNAVLLGPGLGTQLSLEW